jgi:uridine kinase
MIVGVTGIDASGKSTMTTLLAEELKRSGLSVEIVRLDDFHQSRADRHPTEIPEPEQYFEHGFDFERLRNEILKPIRDNGILEASLVSLDLLEDAWTAERKYSVSRDTIVLLDGVFLFRPDIAHFLDLIIFLEVDAKIVLERAQQRDVPAHGAEIMQRYETKYLPAQRAYLEEYPSERNADVIIDNNDWENPIVIKWHEAT